MTVVVVSTGLPSDPGADRLELALAERGVPYVVHAPDPPADVPEIAATVEVVFPGGRRLADPTDAELDAALIELADTTPRVVERADGSGFELILDDEVISFATTSRRADGSVVVPHVETRMAFRGHGHAAQLMEGMLGILRSTGRRIVPLCPFAAEHVRSDPRHRDLLVG